MVQFFSTILYSILLGFCIFHFNFNFEHMCHIVYTRNFTLILNQKYVYFLKYYLVWHLDTYILKCYRLWFGNFTAIVLLKVHYSDDVGGWYGLGLRFTWSFKQCAHPPALWCSCLYFVSSLTTIINFTTQRSSQDKATAHLVIFSMRLGRIHTIQVGPIWWCWDRKGISAVA